MDTAFTFSPQVLLVEFQVENPLFFQPNHQDCHFYGAVAEAELIYSRTGSLLQTREILISHLSSHSLLKDLPLRGVLN